MKRTILHIIIVSFCLFAMSSCYYYEGNWFYHPINMEGETTKPELVVNGTLVAGEPACIYVNSTRNLQDKANWDTLYYFPNPNNTTIIQPLPFYKHRYITDAVVEMSVDGGDWQELRGEPFEKNFYYAYGVTFSIPHYRYVSDAPLLPGQKVSLRVSHKDFEHVATVTQTIPHFPEASIANVDTFPENKMVKYDILMAAYPEATDDLLRVTSATFGQITDLYSDGYVKNQPQHYSFLFSQDARFAERDALLRRISLGYFSGDAMGLYAPLSTESTTYSMSSYFIPFEESDEYSMYSFKRTDSVVVNISAVSPDEYTNAVSLVSAGIIKQDLIDPFMIDNPAESVSQDINNMLNTLGNLEGSQVFDNVDGGVGHVTAIATQKMTIRFR